MFCHFRSGFMEQDEVTAFLTDLFKKSELRVLIPVDSFCNEN